MIDLRETRRAKKMSANKHKTKQKPMDQTHQQPSSQDWISTKIKLPATYKRVLATYYKQADNYRKVIIAYREEDGSWKVEFGGYCDPDNIIAWAPLPQPFEE